jgi:TolB-like protein/class 3 adenylate cyclase/Flp pilus assembly protein TadD
VDADGVERRLTAILSADVVGYSRLMAEDEVATVRTLRTYRDEIGLLVQHHRGRVVDSPGDNLLAEFPSALEAAGCAVEIQRVLGARNAALPVERKMEFRLGVHIGDVMVEGERIYGDGLNVAARLEGLADPGGICISGNVHVLIRNRLGVSCEDLGEQKVKNIAEPVRVYRVAVEPQPESSTPRRLPQRVALVLFVLLLGASVFTWWVVSRDLRPTGTAGEVSIESLAVLPLDNLSGDAGQDYFSDGMTEALISELAKIRALRVISRTSVMQYKGARRGLPEIARELNVDAVVEGSVLRAGDRVRITAQLIHASTDRHLWAESYERDLRDILALQRELAGAISREIRMELTPEAETRPGRVNPRAHDAYLKGRYYLDRQDSEKALSYFQKAIDEDPAYAPAYSGLADYYSVLGVVPAISPQEVMPKARAAALKALELDDTLAHASLAMVRFHYEWDWAGAEKEFRRALELNPSYAHAHANYALYLGAMGRIEESLAAIDRAEALDPLSPRIQVVSAIFQMFVVRNNERAIQGLREVLEMAPQFEVARASLAVALGMSTMHDEAIEEARRAVDLSSRNVDSLTGLAWVYANAGRGDEARKLLEELVELSKQGYVPHFQIAEVYAGLGEGDEALEWLERAYEERSASLPWLTMDPILDLLHPNPRFQDLVRRLGLPAGKPVRRNLG